MSDLEPTIEDYRMTYRGWTGNIHRTALGAYDDTKQEDTDVVEMLDWTPLSVRDQREGRHLQIGGTLGVGTEQFRYITLQVRMKRLTFAALEDAKSAFARAFDLQEAQIDSPSTRGISAFAFRCPTGSPPSGYTSPVDELFLARPMGGPQGPRIVRSEGKSVIGSVQLVCEDPRRYIDPGKSIVLNSGNGYSASCPNWGATMGVLVEPVISIVLSGAGHASLTISDGSRSLVMDMSGQTSGTFTVDTRSRRIRKGSTDKDDVRTSSAILWPVVVAAGNTWTATGTTNLTSVTISYRPARA